RKAEDRISELEGIRIRYIVKTYHKDEPTPENLEAIRQVELINARIGELRRLFPYDAELGKATEEAGR
ncbi:MAG: hypothetical protein KGI38_12915, partial [Thaumarchaeota archaeon]|nr:hypothetical protein [Nitrososphaerota archaeon]